MAEAEPGGGGGRLMEGYRFPLRGLRPDEAEALLILGVPEAIRELGLDRALSGSAASRGRSDRGLHPTPHTASDVFVIRVPARRPRVLRRVLHLLQS